LLEGRVVGGLTAHELPRHDSPCSELYIYDVAILPEFQHKGLGKKLMDFQGSYSRSLGIREYFVEANRVDQGAVRFYKACGGKTEAVVHFNFSTDQDLPMLRNRRP
ncbi:MAG TPA: GNAT family N-acetyltransferase, partial [Chitinophagaceae bacterium]|nr:GNAT family N-acetyltransferase [Chitinophagaceae bacterium]